MSSNTVIKSVPAAAAALIAHNKVMSPWMKDGIGNQGAEDSMIDILVSLRHYCHAHNVVFESAVAASLTQFAEEITGTEIS